MINSTNLENVRHGVTRVDFAIVKGFSSWFAETKRLQRSQVKVHQVTASLIPSLKERRMHTENMEKGEEGCMLLIMKVVMNMIQMSCIVEA